MRGKVRKNNSLFPLSCGTYIGSNEKELITVLFKKSENKLPNTEMMEQQIVKEEQQGAEEEVETDHSDYDAKIETMQKYLPFLNQLIQRLEAKENKDQRKIMQMQLFRRLLQNTAERITINELQRCELALSKICKLHEQSNNCDNNSGCNERTNTIDQTVETLQDKIPTAEKNTSLKNNIILNHSLIEIKAEDTPKLEIEIEPEMVFVPQIKNTYSIYEYEDDLNKDSSSEDENSRFRPTSIANIGDCDIDDNDDIQVIEVRNSPICLDSDDDKEENEETTKSQRSRTPTSTIRNVSPAKKVPLIKGKGYARKSTASSAKSSSVKRNRTVIPIDDSDTLATNSGTPQSKLFLTSRPRTSNKITWKPKGYDPWHVTDKEYKPTRWFHYKTWVNSRRIFLRSRVRRPNYNS